MYFNSLAFAVFLPIVLAGYYMLTRRWQNAWLVAAGVFFYAWLKWWFPGLLAGYILINYLCGLRIGSGGPRAKKLYLAISVITGLVALGFFKYCNFFIGSVSDLLTTVGLPPDWTALRIILPIGISFYTFRTLSYTIDIYRGKLEPCRDLLTFSLYVSFFPQLLAGPIDRAHRLLPQFESKREVRWEHLRQGAVLILIGLFKKVAVADALTGLIDTRFANPELCAGPDLLYALYLYSVKIYCDFAGYSSMSRGVGKLFGFDLMVNFNQPYLSTSVTEFWRRWHISLSTWLRDYLYIPLGGNRKGVRKTYRNLMLTMVLGGLWHGANWTFVVWGGLHGIYLTVHKFILSLTGKKAAPGDRPALSVGAVVKMIVTFHLVALAWLFFRAGSFSLAWEYFTGIVTWRSAVDGGIAPLNWLSLNVVPLVLALVIVDVVQWRSDSHTSVLQWPWPVRAVTYAGLILLLLTLGGIDVQAPFVYFQF